MAIKVAFAGGGTGGHVFPALALAEEFLRRDPQSQIIFFGTENGLEAKIVGQGALRTGVSTVHGRGQVFFCAVKVSPLRGKGPVKVLRGILSLPRAASDSFRGLRKFSPQLIIGVGGYASGPILVAGIIMGIPTVLQEQNILPGMTNRILGRFVTRIFLSFEDSERYFPRDRSIVAGNPIRRDLVDLRRMPDRRSKEFFTIFLVGGSQGAHKLNEIMVQALDALGDAKRILRIIHQTGPADVGWVKTAYDKKGFLAEVHPFIEEMSRVYSESRLVVSRAGATTLAELMAVGRASLLIPYPYAAGGHQEMNARWMADRGAAEVLMEDTLTGARLAETIMRYMKDDGKLSDMEERAKALARPDAAGKIVEECWRLINGRAPLPRSDAKGGAGQGPLAV